MGSELKEGRRGVGVAPSHASLPVVDSNRSSPADPDCWFSPSDQGPLPPANEAGSRARERD